MRDTLTQSNLKLREGTMALNNENHSPIPDDPRSPPESPLFYVSKTKIYDKVIEEAGERRERKKSQLRRRKDGKRPKSASLNRARMEILKSALSDHIVRPNSVASELSIISDQSNDNEPRILYDKDGEIIYPPKRTRSVSRMHQRMEERKKTHCTSMKCPYPQCKDFNDSLHKENMNFIHHLVSSHLELEHRHRLLYKCDFCDLEYCTKEFYDIHMRTHDHKPVLCGRCGVEQKNVEAFQQHMDEHLNSSFKCHLCDLDFITKMECNGHIFSVHHQRKMYKKKELKIVKKVHHKKQARPKVRKQKYRSVNLNVQIKPEESFRPRPFTEMAYLSTKRKQDTDVDGLLAEPKPMRLYGGPMIYNTELADDLILNPPSYNRDDESPLIFKHFPNKRKKTSLSGRSTPAPFSGGMVYGDEQELIELSALSNNDWLDSRRDLESRNEEVAALLGGMDGTSSKSSRSPMTYSEPDDDRDTDFETENHDLDLSSIENDYESQGS